MPRWQRINSKKEFNIKNLSIDLIKVTEAGAIAASAWIGSGEKELADKAATEAMRNRLNKIGNGFYSEVVIGEGEKDKSYMLARGERFGHPSVYYGQYDSVYTTKAMSPKYDIAVDPIEGTRPTVNGGPEALSVICFSERDSMMPIKDHYVMKLVYGPEVLMHHEMPCLTYSLKRNIKIVSEALDKDISKLVVCVLDRERHSSIIKELRDLGVRIKLIQDCDVSGAIATCLPESGVDMLHGIGGAPEAIITACAMKCLGGTIKVQPLTSNDKTNVVWDNDDLVKGECIFAATGITNGSILKGVRYRYNNPITHSVFMRTESGTRWIETEHSNQELTLFLNSSM